jgi:hypothetical protein
LTNLTEQIKAWENSSILAMADEGWKGQSAEILIPFLRLWIGLYLNMAAISFEFLGALFDTS